MTNIPNEQLFLRRGMQSSRVGDDTIIFDDRVGKYYVTGQVGGDIWEMLSSSLSESDICTRLLARYDIDALTCRSQVEDFLHNMMNVDLIEMKSSGRS